MTTEQAITNLQIIKNMYTWSSGADDALNMTIRALQDIEQIKNIINAPVYIQEDVIRYQMICEVINNDKRRSNRNY